MQKKVESTMYVKYLYLCYGSSFIVMKNGEMRMNKMKKSVYSPIHFARSVQTLRQNSNSIDAHTYLFSSSI